MSPACRTLRMRSAALEGTEVHRFRLPAFRGALDQPADAPVFDCPATRLDRDCDLGHDSHDCPSPGCGRAGPRSPLRLAHWDVLWLTWIARTCPVARTY